MRESGSEKKDRVGKRRQFGPRAPEGMGDPVGSVGQSRHTGNGAAAERSTGSEQRGRLGTPGFYGLSALTASGSGREMAPDPSSLTQKSQDHRHVRVRLPDHRDRRFLKDLVSGEQRALECIMHIANTGLRCAGRFDLNTEESGTETPGDSRRYRTEPPGRWRCRSPCRGR